MGQLHTSADKKRIGGGEQRVGAFSGERCESRVDLVRGHPDANPFRDFLAPCRRIGQFASTLNGPVAKEKDPQQKA
jgi:hypothetical protein